MGYNLNTTYSDLAEFEKRGIGTISALFGLASFEFEGEKAKGENNLVDLKLGRVGDFGEASKNSFQKDHRSCRMNPFSSAAGSSKRTRTPSSGSQVVSCLVDGCEADLSKCRDYHRRHKVCEMHSKTPRVTIGGFEQRFCQQCSRFHSLGEFDEGKRSCRKRLEGHNRRRRKAQPEPLPVNPGNFLSAGLGSRFLPFSSQPMIPAAPVVTTTWAGGVKSESNPALYSSSISTSYSQAYRRQFPFLPVPDSPLSGVSSADQTLHYDPNNGGGSSSSNNSQKIVFCNGLNQVINSDRALSLLSSPAETPEMGLGRITHHPTPLNPARPMFSDLHYNLPQYHQGSSQALHPEGSGMFSNIRSSNSFCQDPVFQSGADGSSASGGHQTLSFSWE